MKMLEGNHAGQWSCCEDEPIQYLIDTDQFQCPVCGTTYDGNTGPKEPEQVEPKDGPSE
jgi:hypothetical protein